MGVALAKSFLVQSMSSMGLKRAREDQNDGERKVKATSPNGNVYQVFFYGKMTDRITCATTTSCSLCPNS